MSNLGEIFHVKKDGVQYDAHAYTTLDECPEPNLKLTYKGQQGYVKLVDKGSGDVPCYVKPKSGSTVYQVKKEYVSVPTGSITLGIGTHTFTVPEGVTNISVLANTEGGEGWYIGVRPRTTHSLVVRSFTEEDPEQGEIEILYLNCYTHDRVEWDSVAEARTFTLSWSPEINKQTPDITDY